MTEDSQHNSESQGSNKSQGLREFSVKKQIPSETAKPNSVSRPVNADATSSSAVKPLKQSTLKMAVTEHESPPISPSVEK